MSWEITLVPVTALGSVNSQKVSGEQPMLFSQSQNFWQNLEKLLSAPLNLHQISFVYFTITLAPSEQACMEFVPLWFWRKLCAFSDEICWWIFWKQHWTNSTFKIHQCLFPRQSKPTVLAETIFSNSTHHCSHILHTTSVYSMCE